MREAALLGGGAQVMDTRSYEVSELDVIEFVWENPQLEVDALFRPTTDTSFSQTAFDSLEKVRPVENPILLDDEQDDENWSRLNPVSERPDRLPTLPRNCKLGTRIENGPDYDYENVLQ